MDKAELLYNYPLYSIKRIPTFLKYAWLHSKSILKEKGIKNDRVRLFLDMIWSNLRYGAMDSRDYLMFDFYSKSGKERDTYLTKRRYFRIIKTFDFQTFSKLIVKSNAYNEYRDYIHRNWKIVDANTPIEEIRDFIKKNGLLIAKPNTGEQGKGIFKVASENINDIIDILQGETSYILENLLESSAEIRAINPSSLNTYRIYTIIGKDGEPHILAIMLRVGTDGQSVDNWGSGGIGYYFDLATGICDRPGYDKMRNKYLYHPSSNIKMVGFEIPRFKQLKEFAVSLAKHNTDAIFVGWDIADTPNGFELIEMNFPGGHDFLQIFGGPIYHKMKDILK